MVMEKKTEIELLSEKVRNMLGEIPSVLVRCSTVIIVAIFLALLLQFKFRKLSLQNLNYLTPKAVHFPNRQGIPLLPHRHWGEPAVIILIVV